MDLMICVCISLLLAELVYCEGGGCGSFHSLGVGL